MHGGASPFFMAILPGRNTAYSGRHAANTSGGHLDRNDLLLVYAIELTGASLAILSFLYDKIFEEHDRREPEEGERSCSCRRRSQSLRRRSWPLRWPRSVSTTSRLTRGGPSRTRIAIPRPSCPG